MLARRLSLPAVVAATALAFAAVALTAATAQEGDTCRPLFEDPDADPQTIPIVCETEYFLQCDTAAASKVQVLPPVVSQNAQFTETPPPGSFTEGHGCGELENSTGVGVSQDNIHDFTFQGFVQGNLDSFSVELHDFYVSPSREDDAVTIGVRVAVDGESPFGMEEIQAAGTTFIVPRMVPVDVQPQVSSSGATVSYRFTIAGLDEVLGTASHPGLFPFEREVKVTIDTPDDGAHALVWGADEIPAGLTSNPLEPAGTVVQATG